ncbi:MAG: FHA domain-containing protein [Calothrix sp. MO_167.B42]|nr:FHA domain-containing protein [Calothrix sp. MO_167.B42]
MITCAACGYDKNPDDAEYCEACGSELQAAVAPPPVIIQSPTAEPEIPPPSTSTVIQPSAPEPKIPPPSTPTVIQPSTAEPEIPPPPTTPVFTTTATTGKLVSLQSGSPVSEFTIDSHAVVGIFDPDMGPVDVDLEEFPGGETVSRNHAEIYPEGGVWKIKDLGSTNGIFIKRTDQTRFGARITIPENINFGDEIAFGKVRFRFQTV